MSGLALAGEILALVGAAIFVAAAVGLRRFRDPYARISAVSTAAGLGLAFVTVGALLTAPGVADAVKVALAVALQLATSALAAIVVARSAVLARQPFVAGTDTAALDPDPGDAAAADAPGHAVDRPRPAGSEGDPV